MDNVNELVLCKDNYDTEVEFQNEVRKAIFLLLKAEYIVTIRYDEPKLGVCVIEYNYDDQDGSIGTKMPYWLTPDEHCALSGLRSFAAEEEIDLWNVGFTNCEGKEDE